MEGHEAPVNCIATLKARGSQARSIFATGAADATIKIWHFDGHEIKVLQTIKTNPRYFPLAVAISSVGDDGNTYILASAGTKDIVQIYTGTVDETAAEFVWSATLTGHEGWIRSLDFTLENTESPTSDLLLASASQDKYIRLWRVHQGKELPAQAATASDPTVGAYLPGKSPSNKAHRFQTASGADYSVTFESLLFNHDDWIYSAKWHTKKKKEEQGEPSCLQLLSTSADNSLAIWESDPDSGIWVTTARLGEISREKGATTATGSIGGFWTGLWSPSGTSILTLGRTGSWRRWDWDAAQLSWVQDISVSGHTRPVTGISWAPQGEYLLSTSADQTTRLHARWEGSSSSFSSSSPKSPVTWHEMARPQIHGYDLNCVDVLSATRFVSGADEKLMRVFSMPRAVAGMLETVTGQTIVNNASGEDGTAILPDAANMPVLGLSNKATVEQPDDVIIEQEVPAASANPETNREAVDPATIVRRSALDITHPPFEESLSRYTLWPEIEKLYGHGYEISCLAASHDGKLIASACKASSLNHAVIRIFETERWTELRPPLAVHTLTATRLRFSPDDAFLLSVGRDRQWALFERKGATAGSEEVVEEVKEGEMPYVLRQKQEKGHTRMILDAAWAPPLEEGKRSKFFATAGRDKLVKFWVEAKEDGSFKSMSPMTEAQPVTAVDILGKSRGNYDFVMATGLENGTIRIYTLSMGGSDLNVTTDLVHTIQTE